MDKIRKKIVQADIELNRMRRMAPKGLPEGKQFDCDAHYLCACSCIMSASQTHKEHGIESKHIEDSWEHIKRIENIYIEFMQGK